MKTCSQCRQTLPAERFHKDKSTPTGLRTYCKDCTRERFQTKFKAGDAYQRRLARYSAQRSAERKENPTAIWVHDAFHNAKGRARRARVPFTITKEDVAEMLGEQCPVFGTPYAIGGGKSCDESPSIDRRQPELGYTRENCWVISVRANRIKNNATPEEIMRLAEALAQ